MQPLNKYNKGIKYLLCAIDLFSKYAWVIPVKDKKGTSIANAFQKKITKGRKPNKTWVDQGSQFCNQSFKDFLKGDNIGMYSTYNEEKYVVAERFIRTIKTKIHKYMTTFQKIFIINVLDNIVNKYNNTVQKAIRTKPIDVTDDSYAEYNEHSNNKNPRFKVGDYVRISKYENIFAKGYTPNCSQEVFVINTI